MVGKGKELDRKKNFFMVRENWPFEENLGKIQVS